MNEFYSSEFISLFFKQNFGSVLINSPKFHPEVCLVTNTGFGRLRNIGSHQVQNIRTLHKGFYESGFLLNKIINQAFASMGIGILYRYGPNTYQKKADNFAYKFTLNLNL